MTHNCQKCSKNFPKFYSPGQHKLQQEALRTKVEHELTLETLKMDNLKARNLEDELQSCKLFHVVSVFKNATLKKFNFAKETLERKIMKQKRDHGLEKLIAQPK